MDVRAHPALRDLPVHLDAVENFGLRRQRLRRHSTGESAGRGVVLESDYLESCQEQVRDCRSALDEKAAQV
jgi:hypothetical protein